MNRRERQSAILELVGERALSTQAEVAAALREAGFDVVQTTVSRDIADLGLVKESRDIELKGSGDTLRLEGVSHRLDASSLRLVPASGRLTVGM